MTNNGGNGGDRAIPKTISLRHSQAEWIEREYGSATEFFKKSIEFFMRKRIVMVGTIAIAVTMVVTAVLSGAYVFGLVAIEWLSYLIFVLSMIAAGVTLGLWVSVMRKVIK